jgi:hypothetical protein
VKLVAVTRIRGEDDIVEAFVRHHAPLLDGHVLLDNMSPDRTPDILGRLAAEGLPLAVHVHPSVAFDQAEQMRRLAGLALAAGADWILPLDCDEFIDPRPIGASLREALRAVPAQAPCVEVAMVNHQPTAIDDRAELLVPARQQWRDATPSPVRKIFVRAQALARGAALAPGNHAVTFSGTPVPAFRHGGLLLAHYAMRSGWQMLTKALIGRLKVLASGPEIMRANHSAHYREMFENLRDHPEWYLSDPAFLHGTRQPEGLVHDPLPYLGTPLRHTTARQEELHALRSVMAYVEALALSHGSQHPER